MDTLELLLKSEPCNLPEKEVKLKRLSKECGGAVIFKLRALTYNRVAEIKNAHAGGDMEVHILLAGVVSPDLKSEELKKKYNAVTPAEMIKAMLLPGELEDISREIEKLSGYRITTVEEVKKK
ncbi:MAG: phage tail assembly chaperone [Peptococcaceae bacterium]